MRAVDWRHRAAAEAAAHAHFREMMLGIARRYLEQGDAGLRHYHDTRSPTDVHDHAADLIDEEASAGNAPRPLLEYLRRVPTPAPPRATSYLSWTTNSFGLRPTTRLNHTVVLRTEGGGTAGIIATKMLYASHYFHGALDMRYVVAESSDAPRFVLVVVTRTRSDGLTGITGAVIGDTIRRRALNALRNYLRFTKASVEGRYGSRDDR
jgi:hypothetical protein